MTDKQIKEQEGDEAIIRMAAECAVDRHTKKRLDFVKNYGTGRMKCGGPGDAQPPLTEHQTSVVIRDFERALTAAEKAKVEQIHE